jgi:deoxycytidylate deaminase
MTTGLGPSPPSQPRTSVDFGTASAWVPEPPAQVLEARVVASDEDATGQPAEPSESIRAEGPELVLGLVTPLGTNTGDIAEDLAAILGEYAYDTVVLHLSDYLAEKGPLGEKEDQRVRRLIKAGNDFCASHRSKEHPAGDPAAIARLAIAHIRRTRLGLRRQDGDQAAADVLTAQGRPRTAYILHSLKRPAEVQLLRRVYGDQFILIGSQATPRRRAERLMGRPMSESGPSLREQLVRDLIALDAQDDDEVGQRVNKTYPLADYFVGDTHEDRARIIRLLFGEPIAPTVGEFAMYVARASSGRSLAASRKVGAALVVGDSVVATGYNDVPPGQDPDVLSGVDTSEVFKRENVADTLRRLHDAGLLHIDAVSTDENTVDRALAALDGGELLNVIEYQRAVHAEAKTLDDAAVRGVSPVGGDLYVTTFPCHLCYKHCLSTQLATVRYIDPYPKSRATAMYPVGSGKRLLPCEGVAPRRYIQTFETRPPPVSDESGIFTAPERSAALPLDRQLRNDDDRADEERLAISELREEYQ